MNALKIIICSTIGMLIALQIMKIVPNLNAQQLFTDKIQTTPAQTFTTTLNGSDALRGNSVTACRAVLKQTAGAVIRYSHAARGNE